MSGFGPALAGQLIAAASARLAGEADSLSALDAIAGDGDHGVNMATAFADAVRRIAEQPQADSAAVFRATSDAFLETVGGASGALLGAFFSAAAKKLDGNDDPTPSEVVDALAAGAARLVRVGRSERGQKTMVDALLPALDAAYAAVHDGADLRAAVTVAAAAARNGADATAVMTPGAGRARYAEAASMGSPDPGATTIAHIFAAWAEVLNTEVVA